ncbi:diguanylate cyclase [Niveispirillum sp. SYP-B3756]|uniref:GGDEF domain-containing protein n=1 Tax=Niveispirillum sp. SYP-B3756 TaxID=2662178 RepID=UPI001290D3D6|nr:diguanylate cyclase [Niveispirillum sp. SYP-B3756]MQP64758.1 diguanylate cyclase [Niveispirillum sp. SYP-B3756]
MSVVTLLLVNMLLHLTAGVCLFVAGRSLRAGAALSLWGLSNLVYAAGFIILLQRFPRSLDAYISLGGNLLIDLGAAIAFLSLHQFLSGSRRDLWPLLPAGLLSLAKIAITLALEYNLSLNVVLGCLSRALLAAMGSWLLLRRAEPWLRPASWTVAGFQLLWVLLLLIRGGWEFAWMLEPDAAMMGLLRDPTSAISLLLRSAITFIMTVGFLWMMGRRLEATLVRQATEDPLTGVANRRALWEKAERLVGRAVPRGAPLAVLMVDIDHFKSVNDRWGHGMGDRLLKAVARTLADGVRADDMVARVGGEEFAVLLPDADAAMAAAVAERVRAAVALLQVEGDDGALSCTVSIGHASLAPGLSWEGLVKAADEALYRAKRGGRNRVEAAAAPVA